MRKKDNPYIRKTANNLLTNQLRKLFFDNDMNLKENPSTADEDMGIDYFFEVFDDCNSKETKHLFFLYNQNKGTENLRIIKTKNDENFGKIAFSLSIRHVEYFYYELDERLLFTICDIKNDKVYWYDIQNDHLLAERIIEQKNKSINSIIIYIPLENILNEITFPTLLKNLNYAKYNQTRKKDNFSNATADYSETEQVNIKNISDKILYTINLFEGIKVLPENVICQLHPFKGSQGRTNIFESTFETDNEDFFEFMNSIFFENNDLKILNDPDTNSTKLREIIDFFQVNEIYHIRWSGKKMKKQICVHKLFHYSECDCERCNLERLNLVRTQKLLRIDKDDTVNALLRKGYTHYLLGNYIDAYKVFFRIYKEANKKQTPVNYTISKYNLIKLRGFISSFYYEENRNEILKELEKIRFENDERFIKEHAPYFVDIYKNIKEQKFYDNVISKIDESFLKIQKFYYKDNNGGSGSNNAYYKLESSFLRFNSYIHNNFIIFNYYQEYTDLSKKILESLLILHTLKNSQTEKYELFDWYILEIWIFHIEEEHISYLLKKYEITNLRVNHNILDRLELLINNLFDSYSEFSKHSSIFRPIRLGKIINNIIVILSLINVDNNEKENLVLKILSNSDKLKEYNLIPFDGLYFYAMKKETCVNKKTLEKIFNIFMLNNQRYNYIAVLEKYFELCDENEIEKILKSIFKINDFLDINTENEYFEDLLYSFSLLSKDSKEKLKNKFDDILSENFDFSLYTDLLLYDLIDLDRTKFDNYLSYIVDMSEFDEKRFPFHSFQNLNLYNIMSVVFKYGLEVNEVIKFQINKVYYKEKDYFEWLMDIDNFDYSKFDSYWILRSRTKYYKERFRKSSRLKEELVKSLKDNYIEGVAKMYFRELI
ncbi:DUF4365 domain-containing protein [Chryseobacterium sp. 7]|uniref:DUF4365 domain-containing protein n=1 Tax=Chryseobacterium sp. 7 TaxID=2035214 RepID=UPI0015FF1BC9|nr:DUF4365 domain-containing protein [Chryseobacterium sp. 7]